MMTLEYAINHIKENIHKSVSPHMAVCVYKVIDELEKLQQSNSITYSQIRMISGSINGFIFRRYEGEKKTIAIGASNHPIDLIPGDYYFGLSNPNQIPLHVSTSILLKHREMWEPVV